MTTALITSSTWRSWVSSDWNNLPNLNSTTSIRQTECIPGLSNWKEKKKDSSYRKDCWIDCSWISGSLGIDPIKFDVVQISLIQLLKDIGITWCVWKCRGHLFLCLKAFCLCWNTAFDPRFPAYLYLQMWLKIWNALGRPCKSMLYPSLSNWQMYSISSTLDVLVIIGFSGTELGLMM